MGLKQLIARIFGNDRSVAVESGTTGGTGHVSSSQQSAPMSMHISADHHSSSSDDSDADIDADVLEPAEQGQGTSIMPNIKNRQELVNELKKNYSEVLEIVRKVDGHLDETTRRSDEMIQIARDSAEQNRRIAEAMTQLVEMTRSGQEQNGVISDRLSKTALQQLEATQQQTSAIGKMQSAIHQSGEADRELAQSVSAFTGELGGVSAATNNLGEAITAMRENDAEREKELATLVASSQRWLIFAVVACGLLAVGTLVVVLIKGL